MSVSNRDRVGRALELVSLQFNTLLNQADIAPAAVRLLRHQGAIAEFW
jgi:hypothetical protein